MSAEVLEIDADGQGDQVVERVAAVDVALHGDGENAAQRGRKVRMKVGMGKHGGADNYFAACIDLAVCGLL